MRNLDLYGLAKVRREYAKRAVELETKSLQTMTMEEIQARVLAWNAFVRDEYTIDYNLNELLPVIKKQYSVAIKCFAENDNLGVFRCSLKEFGNYFNDEIDVISKAVTKKGVQLAFRICQIGLIAIVFYGILSLIK